VRRSGVLAALFAVLVAVLVAVAPAHASRLVTLTGTSRFVDPSKVEFNGPPPDTAARPNALRVNVLLPDGYTKKKRWPVLYLLHGHGDGYDYWANPKRGNIAEIAKGLPAIVVMPEAARGWYTSWWNGGARSPGWESYHLGELTQLIDKHYPIRAGRRWHAIAGMSMGGEGAMFYATQRPGYFGSAASFSGVLNLQRPEWPQAMDTQGESHLDVFGDPDAQRFYWTGHNPTALVDNLRSTRVYVTVGDGVLTNPGEITNPVGGLAEAELRQHAADFDAAARAAGVDITYRPRGGIHDWPYWREHMADALRWGFFAPVPEHPSAWKFSTVQRFSSAWGLRILFPKAPDAVATFERDGNALKATGSGLVRIRGPHGGRVVRQLPFAVPYPQ
jgi:S-formylglutathione hydrolase FrmB